MRLYITNLSINNVITYLTPDVRWRCHVSTSLVLKIQKEDKREGEEGKEVDCGFSHGRITRQSAGSCSGPHCGMNAFFVLEQCLFVIRGQLELCPLYRVFSSLWMSLGGWFFAFMLLAASPPCHARYAASWEQVSSSRLHLLSSYGFSSSSSLICVIFTSMSSSSVSSCGVDRTLKLFAALPSRLARYAASWEEVSTTRHLLLSRVIHLVLSVLQLCRFCVVF